MGNTPSRDSPLSNNATATATAATLLAVSEDPDPLPSQPGRRTRSSTGALPINTRSKEDTPRGQSGKSNTSGSPYELEIAASFAKDLKIAASNVSPSSNSSSDTCFTPSAGSSFTTTYTPVQTSQDLYPIKETSTEASPADISPYLGASGASGTLSNPQAVDRGQSNGELQFKLEMFSSNPVSSASPVKVTTRAPSVRSVSNEATKTSSSLYDVNIDDIIERLTDYGLARKSPRKFQVTSEELRFVCAKARQVFLSQPMLLELAAPVKVVGDIHGQFYDLLRVFKLCGFPPDSNYLFLGDYVDRGRQSLETIVLLMCLKIKFPENFFMLRGNHESASITKMYGFYDECKRRSSVKAWKAIVDVFNTLPVAATIAGKIFCVHGGISPSLGDLSQIKKMVRPTDIPDEGLLADLLWSDPFDKEAEQKVRDGSREKIGELRGSRNVNYGPEWLPNDRGVSYQFTERALKKFLNSNRFDLIVRGHMVVEDGYEFFGKRRLVTVFSAPNYCGEFGNWGAVMNVGPNLKCSFEMLRPGKR